LYEWANFFDGHLVVVDVAVEARGSLDVLADTVDVLVEDERQNCVQVGDLAPVRA
jgi:hypothetical protein